MPEGSLVESPFVVRGAVLDAWRDADAIREVAATDAIRIRDEATAAAERIRVAARQDAAATTAATLANAAVTAKAFLAAREAELTMLAFAIADRLVGAMPQDERSIALVRTALAEHRDWARLVVRVPPSVAPALRTALADAELEIREDGTLAPEEAVLLHPAGRTALGPIAQFRALLETAGALRA